MSVLFAALVLISNMIWVNHQHFVSFLSIKKVDSCPKPPRKKLSLCYSQNELFVAFECKKCDSFLILIRLFVCSTEDGTQHRVCVKQMQYHWDAPFLSYSMNFSFYLCSQTRANSGVLRVFYFYQEMLHRLLIVNFGLLSWKRNWDYFLGHMKKS